MNTQVLGISVDSNPCLKAWADSLGAITYPLLSDFYPHGAVAQKYGILRAEGFTERAIFVIDKQSNIFYVDVHDIDQQPDNEELFSVLARLEPEASKRIAQREAQKATSAAEPQADVVLYCTPWCGECRQARDYLKKKGITYVEIDISRDRTAAQRVRNWTGGTETTPTFKIKGHVLINFKRDELDKLLELVKSP